MACRLTLVAGGGGEEIETYNFLKENIIKKGHFGPYIDLTSLFVPFFFF